MVNQRDGKEAGCAQRVILVCLGELWLPRTCMSSNERRRLESSSRTRRATRGSCGLCRQSPHCPGIALLAGDRETKEARGSKDMRAHWHRSVRSLFLCLAAVVNDATGVTPSPIASQGTRREEEKEKAGKGRRERGACGTGQKMPQHLRLAYPALSFSVLSRAR